MWKYCTFLLIALDITIFCYDLSFDQFIKSTPSTFGLITVTHARNGVYTYFKKHLDTYASMECSEITEISVVWNNDVEPESVGFAQDAKWKRPVYFVKTPYNSMDFRYTLPKESKAQVFFSIDDDVIVTCEELRKSFALWKSKAIGDIAPLITYGPRGFSFNLKNQQFVYGDPLKAKFFSISLIGICWVPRFYFQLYNSEGSWQINSMRQIVKQKNNCDDIALNFIVNYFFPQFIPIALNETGRISMQIHPSSQATSRTHYPYRNQCLKRFTEIFGFNPLRIINKADHAPEGRRYESAVNKYVIYLKRKELAERLVEKGLGNKETTSLEDVMEIQERIKQQITERNSQAPISNSASTEQIEQLKQELQKVKVQYYLLQQKALQKDEQDKKGQNQGKINEEKLRDDDEKVERVRKLLDLVFLIVLAACLFVSFMCFCLFKNSFSKSQKPQAANPKASRNPKPAPKQTRTRLPSSQFQEQYEPQEEQQ